MKTAFTFIIFLSVLNSTANAQNRITDTSATCIAFWKKKETKVYTIKRIKEKYEAEKVTDHMESSYEAYLRIIDSSASGYTIEWTYRNFKTEGKNTFILSGLNSVMENLKIIYTTDELGMFTGLVNWYDVRDFALSNYQKTLETQSENKEFVIALNQIKSIFQSKENIETLLIREIQLYHSPYGVEYNIKGTPMKTELPNVTGGSPIPATITPKLDELNDKNNYVKVSLNQTIDKGKGGPIIAAMLKKLSTNPNEDENKIRKEIQDMEISDINEFTYSINSGWLSRIFYKRISNLANLKQVESYEIIEKK
jgi:hypothetical protein